jgi:hypothetical protein
VNVLLPGHPARKKLDAIQADIAGARAEIVAIEKAPLALEDQRELLRADIAGKFQKADPESEIRRFHKLRADGTRPSLTPRSERGRMAGTWDIVALIFDREEIEARLLKRLEQSNEGKELGLPLAKRSAKIADLQQKISLLENREELEILKLEEERYTVVRRGDADPKLLLEIWRAHRPEATPKVPAGPVGVGRLPHINAGTRMDGGALPDDDLMTT